MSEENVEIVRKMNAVFNTATYDLDDWLDEFFDPDIEYHDVPSLPDGGIHRGRAALRRHVAGYLAAWGKASIEIEDIRAVGERELVRGRYSGVGSQSGAQVIGALSLPASAVYDFRSGRILRVRQYLTYAEALKAVDLSE